MKFHTLSSVSRDHSDSEIVWDKMSQLAYIYENSPFLKFLMRTLGSIHYEIAFLNDIYFPI